MDSLFNKINCDRSAITDMLGGKSGATDSNMMQVNKHGSLQAMRLECDIGSIYRQIIRTSINLGIFESFGYYK